MVRSTCNIFELINAMHAGAREELTAVALPRHSVFDPLIHAHCPTPLTHRAADKAANAPTAKCILDESILLCIAQCMHVVEPTGRRHTAPLCRPTHCRYPPAAIRSYVCRSTLKHRWLPCVPLLARLDTLTALRRPWSASAERCMNHDASAARAKRDRVHRLACSFSKVVWCLSCLVGWGVPTSSHGGLRTTRRSHH
jgi:hypothetical protein